MNRNNLFLPITELLQHECLLRMEYEEEKKQHQEQTQYQGIPRKVQNGLCWYPLSLGKSYYNSVNQFVVEVIRTSQQEVEHLFEPGSTVSFFTENLGGKLNHAHFTSQVSYVNGDIMVIVLSANNHYSFLQTTQSIGVQLYFDETSYRVMFDSLHRVINARDNKLSDLRESLLGVKKLERRELYPIRYPWLNPSQQKAVNDVLNARLTSIVHGPPGTGKTTTMVEAIYETLQRENQILVCAQSNMAVDWISEQLVERGIQVLRIGNPSRITDTMLESTYERRFESHSDYPVLWEIRREIREFYKTKQKRNDSEAHRNHVRKLKNKAIELEFGINESLFRDARVISCTLIGSANRVLTGRHFSTLFIDEAAQALEAACWTAILKADRVVFAGDYCQLPPTIKSHEAMRSGLGMTLMEKVAMRHPEVVSLLEVQYRMNEAIMQFPSQWFYHGRLKAAPEVKNRNILDWDTPLVWLDTALCQWKEEWKGESRINIEEANELLRQLRGYIEGIGIERVLEERIDFGIISPYKAQVHYLRRCLKASSFFRPFFSMISVNTVDGFQGQERDVIWISMVRANENGQVGFLNDLRRMNVAITRSRMKLVIMGDSSTLCKHPFYLALHQHIIEYGKVYEILADED